MSNVSRTLAIISTFAFFGCYHATIETGLTPSADVIDESFASCWIYGLVPPSTLSAAAKCPHGVAKVETQLSFVNQLVGILTLGIYTPMEIKVTCAAKSSAMLPSEGPDIVLKNGATEQEILEEFMRAAEMAVKNDRPVFVEY